MHDIFSYIDSQKDRFLVELKQFLAIPSISSDPAHNSDMKTCAKWLADNIKQSGIDDVRIIETAGHELIYAEDLSAGSAAPTILIYGHYDVQPVDPIEAWITPPFEPTVIDNKLYGRGTSDDKGQLFVHVKSIEAYKNIMGKLPVNIKLLIEGEEEAGSSHLDDFIINNKEMLSCDVVLVSDTEWFADGLPSICYGLRGICYTEFTVRGPNRDLHSGTFGGAVDNPLNVLCNLLSALKDNYGRVTIPGFYDNVSPLTDDERAEFKKLPFNKKNYCEDLAVAELYGENGYTTLERVWARPSLDLNGIFGGYTGEGAKTVLPTHATAKLSMRLVPGQDPADIAEKLHRHLKTLLPATSTLEFKYLHGGKPVLVPRNSDAVKATAAAFKKAFGKDTVFMREGGSIPIVEVFDSVLKARTALMGLGLPGDNIHSPNENFMLDNFYGGIKASAIFFEEIAKLNSK